MKRRASTPAAHVGLRAIQDSVVTLRDGQARAVLAVSSVNFGLIGAGAFVAFGDGYEGLLPVRRLRGDWWELNELGTILEGTKTGKAIRLGDPVRVQVDRVDAPRGRVDLLPVEVS